MALLNIALSIPSKRVIAWFRRFEKSDPASVW
jgi:hypothetical protein